MYDIAALYEASSVQDAVALRLAHPEAQILAGGTDVLVEHCRGTAATEYGHRYKMTDEEKRNRVTNSPSCRYNCHTVFLYYCDNRAVLRETPGNITLRHCEFRGIDGILHIPFGHKWCCNRSLSEITFEDCLFEGICKPILLTCPREEPVSVRLRDCTVSARDGFEEIPLATGTNVRELRLEEVRLENFRDPAILCDMVP